MDINEFLIKLSSPNALDNDSDYDEFYKEFVELYENNKIKYEAIDLDRIPKIQLDDLIDNLTFLTIKAKDNMAMRNILYNLNMHVHGYIALSKYNKPLIEIKNGINDVRKEFNKNTEFAKNIIYQASAPIMCFNSLLVAICIIFKFGDWAMGTILQSNENRWDLLVVMFTYIGGIIFTLKILNKYKK